MHLSFPLCRGFAGWVAESGVGLNLPSAPSDPRFDAQFDRTVSAAALAAGDKARARTNFKTRSTLAIPLHNTTGTTIAVFQAINRFKPFQPKVAAAGSNTAEGGNGGSSSGGGGEKSNNRGSLTGGLSSSSSSSLSGISTPGAAASLLGESALSSLLVPFSEEDEEVFRALCTQAGITLRRRLTEVLLGRSRRELGDDKNLGGLFEIYGGNYLSGNSGVVALGSGGGGGSGGTGNNNNMPGGTALQGGQLPDGAGGGIGVGHSHSSSLSMTSSAGGVIGGGGMHSSRHSMSTPLGSALSQSFSAMAAAALAGGSSGAASPSLSLAASLARSGSTDFNAGGGSGAGYPHMMSPSSGRGLGTVGPGSASRNQSSSSAARRKTMSEASSTGGGGHGHSSTARHSGGSNVPPIHPHQMSPSTASSSTSKVAAVLLSAATLTTPTRSVPSHTRGPSATPGAAVSSLPTIPSSPSPKPSPTLTEYAFPLHFAHASSSSSSASDAAGTGAAAGAGKVPVLEEPSELDLDPRQRHSHESDVTSPASTTSSLALESEASPTLSRLRSRNTAVTALSVGSRRARSDDAVESSSGVDLVPSKFASASSPSGSADASASPSEAASLKNSAAASPDMISPRQLVLSIVPPSAENMPMLSTARLEDRAASAAAQPVADEEIAEATVEAEVDSTSSPSMSTALVPMEEQQQQQPTRAIVGFVQHNDEMSLTRRRLGAGGGPAYSQADSSSVVTMSTEEAEQVDHDTVGSAASYSWPLLSELLLSRIDVSALHAMDTFDVFSYSEDELVHFCLLMLADLGLLSDFSLRLPKLQSFLVAVRLHYNANPYHCFQHGFSVMHFAFWMLRHTDAGLFLPKQEQLALLVAALCHDVDHPGTTNGFQIACESAVARAHNDQSVLEHHHAFVTFELLRDPRMNVFSATDATEEEEQEEETEENDAAAGALTLPDHSASAAAAADPTSTQSGSDGSSGGGGSDSSSSSAFASPHSSAAAQRRPSTAEMQCSLKGQSRARERKEGKQ